MANPEGKILCGEYTELISLTGAWVLLLKLEELLRVKCHRRDVDIGVGGNCVGEKMHLRSCRDIETVVECVTLNDNAVNNYGIQ